MKDIIFILFKMKGKITHKKYFYINNKISLYILGLYSSFLQTVQIDLLYYSIC